VELNSHLTASDVDSESEWRRRLLNIKLLELRFALAENVWFCDPSKIDHFSWQVDGNFLSGQHDEADGRR
jgi:hypothetical protein